MWKFITGLGLVFGLSAPAWSQDFSGCSQATAKFRNLKQNLGPDANALQKLRQEADQVLGAPLLAVTQKTKLPPSGDPHDYMSLSIYWWPNPWTPNGLPYIEKDGQRNPEAQLYDEPKIQKMLSNAYTLSLAAFYTGDIKYANQAALILETWFLNPDTKMNPHLKYGQGIPGLLPGARQGIIETVGLAQKLLNIMPLLADFQPTLPDSYRPWIRDYRNWLQTSLLGKLESDRSNNHGTYFDLQMSCYALFLKDRDAAKKIILERSLKRIDQQFAEDGSQPEEIKRTRSLDYSVYNLQAWFHLAALAEQLDIDLWRYQSPKGRSLRKALDFLVSFVEEDKPWPYEQITKSSFYQLHPFLTRAARIYQEPRYLKVRDSLGVSEEDWQGMRESLIP